MNDTYRDTKHTVTHRVHWEVSWGSLMLAVMGISAALAAGGWVESCSSERVRAHCEQTGAAWVCLGGVTTNGGGQQNFVDSCACLPDTPTCSFSLKRGAP